MSDLVNAWCLWLLHSGWQAAVVVVAVTLILIVARRRSAQLRYALLIIALAKFATPPFMALPVGLFSQTASPLTIELTASPLVERKENKTGEEPAVEPTQKPVDSAVALTTPQQKLDTTAPNTPTVPEKPGDQYSSFHWMLLGVVAIHLVGVLISSYFVWLQYAKLRRLIQAATLADGDLQHIATNIGKRLGLKKTPDVLVSTHTDAPFATGFLKQVIVLPQSNLDLPEDQLQIILGHEMVHIRRWDLSIGWLETMLSLVWWFHPGMWWLKRELRKTREDCCDDALLTSQLTEPERYCETLIDAAVRQTFQPSEPVALGFSHGEHPAARRIRRLMDSSQFRSKRLGIFAIVMSVLLAIIVLPGMQPLRAPVSPTNLEGLFGWRNLPFDPPEDELAIINDCEPIVNRFRSVIYTGNGQHIRGFDKPETKTSLEELLNRKPDFFYPMFLLGTWHRRNGDAAKAETLIADALKNAPKILVHRYHDGNDQPLPDIQIDHMDIECNRVKNGSLDPSLELAYIDLVTDRNGEIMLPVYDTVYRLSTRSFPRGYDTEMASQGWFVSRSRIGVLPEIMAWKSHSRPDFTRSASDSAVLKEARGTTSTRLTSGSNMFHIGRVARAQVDGQFLERIESTDSTLPAPPKIDNAPYMDHAVIDLASPVADRIDITRVTALDSKTKIPLNSYQLAAGVKTIGQTRFHLYSLYEPLPPEIDLVLTVKNYDADVFRMIIPPEPSGQYTQESVTFINEYLAAGQHAGWSSKDGFYKDPKYLDFTSEMLFKVDFPDNQRYSLFMVTKSGQRFELWEIITRSMTFPAFARIEQPLSEIDHFELLTRVEPEKIYFEKIALPQRTAPLSRELPELKLALTGNPETIHSEAFAPMTLRCRTLRGKAYADSSFSGEFGWAVEDQILDKQFPDSKSTVVIEAFGLPELVFRETVTTDEDKLKSSSSSSQMSGRWGRGHCNTYDLPLEDLRSLTVRFEAPGQQ